MKYLIGFLFFLLFKAKKAAQGQKHIGNNKEEALIQGSQGFRKYTEISLYMNPEIMIFCFHSPTDAYTA